MTRDTLQRRAHLTIHSLLLRHTAPVAAAKGAAPRAPPPKPVEHLLRHVSTSIKWRLWSHAIDKSALDFNAPPTAPHKSSLLEKWCGWRTTDGCALCATPARSRAPPPPQFKTFVIATLVAAAAASCPNSCSGHGICGANDVCSCWLNFEGPDCSQRELPPRRTRALACAGDGSVFCVRTCVVVRSAWDGGGGVRARARPVLQLPTFLTPRARRRCLQGGQGMGAGAHLGLARVRVPARAPPLALRARARTLTPRSPQVCDM